MLQPSASSRTRTGRVSNHCERMGHSILFKSVVLKSSSFSHHRRNGPSIGAFELFCGEEAENPGSSSGAMLSPDGLFGPSRCGCAHARGTLATFESIQGFV